MSILYSRWKCLANTENTLSHLDPAYQQQQQQQQLPSRTIENRTNSTPTQIPVAIPPIQPLASINNSAIDSSSHHRSHRSESERSHRSHSSHRSDRDRDRDRDGHTNRDRDRYHHGNRESGSRSSKSSSWRWDFETRTRKNLLSNLSIYLPFSIVL